ncbi:MAG: hypothetical protein WCK47_02605 [bacterium]
MTEICIICSHPREAAAVAARMNDARKRHFGLYCGYEGSFAGRAAVAGIAGEGENPAYVAVRQLTQLFHPDVLFNFGIAGAVSERMHVGDVVLVRESIRCMLPAVVADNTFTDDNLVFPDDETREHILRSPSAVSDAIMLQSALCSLNSHKTPHMRQRTVCSVRIGCSPAPMEGSRMREFARKRFQVEAADMESYGFLSAAQDVNLPALCLKIISDACGSDARTEFERHARCLLSVGSECLEIVVEHNARAIVC